MPLLTLAAALSGCAPLAGDWPGIQEFPVREADEIVPAPDDPLSLKVLTWNLKFGGARIDFWFDGWGDRVHMTEDEVLYDVGRIRELVDDFDPDLLLTQEVDIGSQRSAYVDMVDEILQGTAMNYAAWVPVWVVQYVPDHGLGRVEMGQAVFSKYPIGSNLRIDLGPIDSQDPVTRYFYLDRCIQHVSVDLGATTLQVLNDHPAAYATDGTKQRQIDDTLSYAEGLSGDLVIGGDFNAVPPGTINLTDFADNPTDINDIAVDVVTYEDEGDQLLAGFYDRYQSALPIAPYQAAATVEEQEPWFSHSISADVFWNRKLDYLFSTLDWTVGAAIQKPGQGTDLDPMTLSDHAPLYAELSLE